MVKHLVKLESRKDKDNRNQKYIQARVQLVKMEKNVEKIANTISIPNLLLHRHNLMLKLRDDFTSLNK